MHSALSQSVAVATSKLEVVPGGEALYEVYIKEFGFTLSGRTDSRWLIHDMDLSQIKELQPETQKATWGLVKHTKEKMGDVNATSAHIQVSVGCRGAYASLDPPERNVIHRFLINLGVSETYELDPDVPTPNTILKDELKTHMKQRSMRKALLSSSGLKKRSLKMTPNTLVALGPSLVSDYVVKVRKASRLRPLDYQRVTIIIDYLGTEEQMLQITEYLRGTVQTVSSSVQGIMQAMGAEEKEELDEILDD